MDKEKPVKVIEHKGRHKTETRVFARNIHETYCSQKGCKFKGGRAQQGICFSDKPELALWREIDKAEQSALDELKYFKKKYKGKEYIDWLESMYMCAMMNWRFTLDEVIRLRRNKALLGLKKK